MTDITLKPIKSGYNLQKINDNFDALEANINTTSLQSEGGNNVLGQDLDMDSHRLLNLPTPISGTEPLRKGDIVSDETGASVQYVDDTVALVEAEVEALERGTVHNVDNLSLATTDATLVIGDALNLKERTAGNGGGAMWDVVDIASVTVNGFDIVAHSSLPLALVLRRNKNNSYTPRQFGFAADGVTDDLLASYAYRDSGITYFDWGSRPIALSDFFQILSGTHHNFSGTTLKALGANKVLRAGFVNDWSVTGSLTLMGTGNGGSEPATDSTVLFEVDVCERYIVENVTCLDSLGRGFYLKGESADRSQKGRWSNCYSYRCQKGWDIEPDGSTEYTTFSNCGGSGNFIGVKTGAGNMSWVGGVITDNARNVELIGGDPQNNHLHGTMVGVMINHATSENVLATDVLYGFTFNGCNFYGDDLFAGRIDLNNSQGITIDGGHLNCRVQITDGAGTITGVNRVSNMLIAGVNANFQGDVSRIESFGHTGLGSIDAKAFNRIQPIALAVIGNWVVAQAVEMEYSAASNIVKLSGVVGNGTNLDIVTIPVGFRPKNSLQLPVDANGGYGSVSINSATGEVRFEVGSGNAVRLDALSWQAWS